MASALSEFPAIVSLTAEELDTPSISHLLHVSVNLEKYARTFRALGDCGSAINLHIKHTQIEEIIEKKKKKKEEESIKKQIRVKVD